MTRPGMSLFDIIHPPGNPWLEKLLSGKAKPPAGVRVVRFDQSDDFDAPEGQSEAGIRLRDFAEA